jgi:mannose-6-phosphate isomerase-like protein (cupin superfamily)
LFGDAATFVDHYERRQVLLHHSDGFADLVDLAEIDRLIGAGVLQVPHDVRMANAVDDAGATTAQRWREAMRGGSPERFDPDAALAGFDHGDTIILHALHQRIPALDRLATSLEHEIGQSIDVNAFLTPPGAQGLDAHYDHHDVIIAQVEGTKTWHLWEPRVVNPLPEHAPGQFDIHGDPEIVTLQHGDTLFVPRGWTHRAVTGERISLHLTIGIIPIPWLEVAHGFLASLDRHDELRRSLPLGYHRDPALLHEGIETAAGMVRAVIDAVDIDATVSELAASFTPRRSTRVGRLVEVVAAHGSLGATTRVALGSQADRTLRRSPGGWLVSIDGNEVPLPDAMAGALCALVDGHATTLANLMGSWDDSVDRVARQLLRHGVISVVEDAG